jgi:hypothetical protein
MRGLLIFIAVVIYLFTLVYIESELVKLEVRKEQLRNQVVKIMNQKKLLEFEVMTVSNLARIEIEAKKQGYVFPDDAAILGIVK